MPQKGLTNGVYWALGITAIPAQRLLRRKGRQTQECEMKRIVLGVAFGCVIGVVNARDLGQWGAINNDPAVREWYQALMQPDMPNASCCGGRDSRQGWKNLRDHH
jgi:hypothetical protein